jgi:hypothetical protein
VKNSTNGETACATHQMNYTGLFLEIIWSKSD